MKTGAIVDPSVSAVGRVFPGPSDAKDLAAFNKETLDALGSRYNLPDIQKDDAHVFRDADGYYQVKEEFTKPTNPFERLKLAKDALKSTVHLGGIEEMAAQIEEAGDFKTWDEAADPDDVDHRPKYAGLFHRRKGHYGRYMMRLKLPNGIVTSEQMRYLGGVVKDLGEDGCADITTRQNMQLRGVELKNASEIVKGCMELNMSTLQSGLDNVRNATGNPLAGFDPHEVVDTRPFTRDIQDYVTGGGRGNPEISNLGRKWNVCVVGGPDFFEHPDINDLAFIPADREGKPGFNILVGGFISSARAAEAVPLDAWVPESEVVALTAAVITTFRDYGHRGNRQKTRMMWLIDEMGIDNFRAEVACRMPTKELAPEAPEDKIDTSIARRSYLGVHKQKQAGLNWVGVCVPGGRLQAEDMLEMANLADMYGSGELRLTVEQNFIFPNIPDAKLDALLAEPLLQHLTVMPGAVLAGMVACPGKQFCGFAQIETKKQAFATAEHLESVLEFPKGDLRMIWTGCPNSCAPVQIADIGIMGAQVKNPNGQKGMVDGVNIFVGGTVGPGGHLKENPEYPKVPVSEMMPLLEKICVEEFGAVRKATPSVNLQNASRWKINKSAQYTKGVPKAMGLATHICTGCGYIYQEDKPFDTLAGDYVCPSCSAPKAKFEPMKDGKAAAPKSARPTKEYPAGMLVTLPGADETVELKLESKADVSPDTRIFRFSLPTDKHILGLPVGQHVRMQFVDSSGKEVSRPYTPISSDDNLGFVEFMVKVYDAGVCSKHLDGLKIGDSMTFSGPTGNLTYTDRGEFTVYDPVSGESTVRKGIKHLGMVCGGTGITPMLQVVKQIFGDVGDTTRVSLVFANKTEGDILLKTELDTLAKEHKNLSVQYTVDSASAGWKGSTGFVDAKMLKEHLPAFSAETQILMCGPPAMVEKAITPALEALGFNEKTYMKF
ncbi:ferredoxin--nitrite reductase [bacterium]|nr:ferredoxin--nitrite reductase [bacterium]